MPPDSHVRRNFEFLADIQKAAHRIRMFAEGADSVQFSTDEQLQSAVIYQLIVIGEATKRLSPEFRDSYPQFEWRRMAGMRDKLVHEFREVNLATVWRTVRNEIPPLLDWVSTYLRSQTALEGNEP